MKTNAVKFFRTFDRFIGNPVPKPTTGNSKRFEAIRQGKKLDRMA
jgi:hypothetical protein